MHPNGQNAKSRIIPREREQEQEATTGAGRWIRSRPSGSRPSAVPQSRRAPSAAAAAAASHAVWNASPVRRSVCLRASHLLSNFILGPAQCRRIWFFIRPPTHWRPKLLSGPIRDRRIPISNIIWTVCDSAFEYIKKKISVVCILRFILIYFFFFRSIFGCVMWQLCVWCVVVPISVEDDWGDAVIILGHFAGWSVLFLFTRSISIQWDVLQGYLLNKHMYVLLMLCRKHFIRLIFY